MEDRVLVNVGAVGSDKVQRLFSLLYMREVFGT